jgi:hypothetical protein
MAESSELPECMNKYIRIDMDGDLIVVTGGALIQFGRQGALVEVDLE